MNLRVATFNCENLFRRPLLFGYSSGQTTDPRYPKVNELETLIGYAEYDKATKTRILELVTELEGVIDMNALRGGLLTMDGRVKAWGRGAWIGGIRLRVGAISGGAQVNTAEVLRVVDADVFVLVEVEDRETLRQFLDNHALSTVWPYEILVEGNDPRGIDVAVISKHPIGWVRSNATTLDKSGKRLFSRDCLEVQVALPNGMTLNVLANHLVSKRSGSVQADLRRAEQGAGIATILGRYDLTKDLVVIAGDFNDLETSPAVLSVLKTPHVVDAFANVALSERWSYDFKGPQQIDHIIVSEPLANAQVKTGAERRGMPPSTGVPHFPTVKGTLTAASDHAALWVDFTLP